MAGHHLHGDHAAHRVAHDVRFLDLQVIEQEDDVLDQLEAVGFLLLGPVRASMSRQIDGDHSVILGEVAEDTRDPPVDVGARVQPMDQDHRLPFAAVEVVDPHPISDVGSREGLIRGQGRAGNADESDDDPDHHAPAGTVHGRLLDRGRGRVLSGGPAPRGRARSGGRTRLIGRHPAGVWSGIRRLLDETILPAPAAPHCPAHDFGRPLPARRPTKLPTTVRPMPIKTSEPGSGTEAVATNPRWSPLLPST